MKKNKELIFQLRKVEIVVKDLLRYLRERDESNFEKFMEAEAREKLAFLHRARKKEKELLKESEKGFG